MQEHTSLICAVVLYFLLVAVALLALYLVERRWRKGP
jgi:hypothetical protein